MQDRKALVRIVLLIAAGAVLIVAARSIGIKRAAAITATHEIEELLASLDPATRASVVARLTADAAAHVKEARQRLAN